jgi:hypothetical protein
MSSHRFPTSIVLVQALLSASLGACTLEPDGMDSFGGGGPYQGASDDDDDVGEDDESITGGSADGSSGGGSAPGDDDSPDPSDDDGSDDATTDAPPDDPPDPGTPDDVSDCSNFTDVQQFFTYVNNERSKYAGQQGGFPHSRWKGLPWQGDYHEQFTFSSTFTWDDGLAAQAQAEAEALAAGGSPSGNQQNGSNGLPICPMSPFWIDGLNTASWKLSLGESEADWNSDLPDSCPPSTFALSPDNQHARMGLHYHDFGGEGPAIHRLGVGAAIEPAIGGGECKVWWVLQFGS